MKPLQEQYRQIMADYVSISIEDLTASENQIIDKSFDLFSSKLEDIKTLNDEVKRLSIELANLKAMTEDERFDDDYEDLLP